MKVASVIGPMFPLILLVDILHLSDQSDFSDSSSSLHVDRQDKLKGTEVHSDLENTLQELVILEIFEMVIDANEGATYKFVNTMLQVLPRLPLRLHTFANADIW